MTPSQIIALIRDAVVVGALVFILWYVHRADTNAATVKDLKAVQAQMEANAKTQSQWAQEARDAEDRRKADMVTVNAAIDRQRAPVRLCNAPGPRAVPGEPATPESSAAGSGGDAQRPRIDLDLRPRINAFEFKYEAALAECRAALASWPK